MPTINEGETLERIATDCDRAIVRMTLQAPSATTSEDVRAVTRALASARDALRWAAKRSPRDPARSAKR